MFLGRHIPDMIRLILKKSNFYNKFKQIYDNLDETIIIINKNNYSIEYMNDYFFKQFKELLKNDDEGQNSQKPEFFNYLIEMKIFEQYKSDNSNQMSLKDIMNNDRAQNKKLVWVFT